MKSVFKFLLSSGLTNEDEVNRLIVSAYCSFNGIQVRNNVLIRELLIQSSNKSYGQLLDLLTIIRAENKEFDFEMLVQLFEFVISPSERIINGAIYTPKHIREYIVDNVLFKTNQNIRDLLTADLSCGCGGFLLTLTERLRERTDKSIASIYADNIFGIDITDYSIKRAMILLSLYAIVNNEDLQTLNFNLFVANSLTFNWHEACQTVAEKNGFDIVVGNPPYVCSRNMDKETLKLLEKWEVSRSGHPDLYIPFFQLGIESLNLNGELGYITVNTFTKSINGRALRTYFAKHLINLSILSFGGEQLFQDRNTYTCICFIDKQPGCIHFLGLKSNELTNVNLLTDLYDFNYGILNHHDGWNLVNGDDIVEFVNLVERTGLPFKHLYQTKNGIATLKNDVYKFKPIRSDKNFHYFNDSGVEWKVEVDICRDIVNANKIKNYADIERIIEKIIFPYDEHVTIICEEVMRRKYPFTLKYLEFKKDILKTRDKGTRSYETWYAYGRRQSMNIQSYKLFFPHICDKPNFIICSDRDLLFYNGLAVVSDSYDDLVLLKKILESELFYKYIYNTTKNYASGYISLSRNYLKNFGVYQFSTEERELFLNSEKSDDLLNEMYGLEGQFA